MKKTISRESDLASVACDHFIRNGYEIRSEVHHVDIVGRDASGAFHAIELKKVFNVDVIAQGLRGQRWAGMASVVVPAPVPTGRGLSAHRKVSDWVRICRGLSLGLFIVRVAADGVLTIEPKAIPIRVSDGRQDMLKVFRKEFAGRREDRNIAGRPGTRLHTAYSAKAMWIARWLIDRALSSGSLGPYHCAVVAAGSGYEDARQIMYAGYRGYFSGSGRGMYRLDRRVMDDADTLMEVTGNFDLAALSAVFDSEIACRANDQVGSPFVSVPQDSCAIIDDGAGTVG